MLKVAGYKGSVRGLRKLLKAIAKENKECQTLGYMPQELWNYEDILRREG